jgi:hypothetical protein
MPSSIRSRSSDVASAAAHQQRQHSPIHGLSGTADAAGLPALVRPAVGRAHPLGAPEPCSTATQRTQQLIGNTDQTRVPR